MNLRPPRSSPRILMFAAAIVLAGLAAWLVKLYLDSASERIAAKYANQGETIEVVVPRIDVAARTAVDTEVFVKRRVLADTAPPDAVRVVDMEQAEGQMLKIALPKGRPLLWTYLSSGREPSFSETIDERKRALTIAVDELNSISGMVRPSDRVDLFFLRDDPRAPAGTPGKMVMPLLQNVLVKATGNTTRREVPPGGGEPVDRSYSTFTLDLDPRDVGRVMLAQDQGALKVVLKMPTDPADTAYVPTTLADLGGPAAPRAVENGITDMIAVYVGGRQQGVLQPTYTAVGGQAGAGRAPDVAPDAELLRSLRAAMPDAPAPAMPGPRPTPAANAASPAGTTINLVAPPPARSRF
ncbi:MAG: Flp pilus assembly protein CpaB [Comamonadaceae bacterium]|nr:MAG: Flp pilus assembly protein CpaB [Comamonadaceae bacterium]